MGRAPCCDKNNVKRGPWSPEEDATLKAYIETYGTGGNWIALPQKIGLKRCGKSCRLRWLNYLRPNIRHGGFTEEEDNIICSLYISIGSRWSIIAAQLPGRTDNDIKNYWNTRLKKKLLGRRKQSNANRLSIPGQEPKDASEEEHSAYNLQNLSNSALERLQLHMQLQNPFSLYNNPALWPKSENIPLHQKMIQTLNSMNENLNTLIPPQPVTLEQDYSPLSNLKNDELENSINGFSSSESSFVLKTDRINLVEPEAMEQNGGIQINSGFTQAELDDLLNNKSSSFLPVENQIAEHNCFKEMNGSKDNLGWWSNEFDATSASWDSTSMLQDQSGDQIYQDYAIGYSMH